MVGHRGACRVVARGPVDASAGVGRGRAEVEAGDAGLGATEAWHRPEDQLLLELGGAAVDGTADQVGVA